MGYAALFAVGIAAAAALWWLGVSRLLWTVVGAALMLGAAGYAWQGRPDLFGHPIAAESQPIEVDPGLVAFREAIMPGDTLTLASADGRLRRGETTEAVAGLLQALADRPRDAALWTALGGVLAAHDGQQLSPAALFAFRRAFQLAPDQPGPPFFLGMAYVQAGEIEAARPAWREALALTPPDAPYRADIAERLAMVDAFATTNAGSAR